MPTEGHDPNTRQARPWTEGPWMCAAKPSSIVGWPVVAPPHGRLICNLGPVSPSAAKSSDPEVKAFFAEVAANGRLIASAPALYEALLQVKSGAEYCDELGDIIDAALSPSHPRAAGGE